FAAKVYENNFGIKPYGDITQIKEEDIPEHDILCGGFPCQAFSISGKQKGFEDTRGTLFFDILRIVKHHKPKILLLENVKNIEKHDKGKTLKVITNSLNNLGYKVNFKVLNASDYGLPQNRERIFIVCFKNDLNITDFQFPSPLKKYISLNDILEENANAKIIKRSDIKIHKIFEPQLNIFGELELPNKPVQIGIVNKGGQGERIYSIYGHACTLSAYGGGAGSKTGIYSVNGVLRKLSTRECARVQGFSDTFKIDNNSGQAYKQFGNSVAVNVLKEIIKQIVEVI
ncbi:MAG: DNA (cytosine-5-)-methyltransferase, partial [Candidatus Sericytochromatia bacterium]|nr:DNA (cytosine-5-)-methyltransferase [Candidatus Sericytochromatia bacterium]